jgi:hypothetical protein
MLFLSWGEKGYILPIISDTRYVRI